MFVSLFVMVMKIIQFLPAVVHKMDGNLAHSSMDLE